MKKLQIYILLLLLSIANNTGAQTWNQSVVAALNKIAAELDTAHYMTGVQVYDLTDNRMLWRYNDQKVMRPASCQKILTTISALDALGNQYELQTTAFCTGNIVNVSYTTDTVRTVKYLQGDIYVRGGFDPTFSFDDLMVLVGAIRGLGIDSIAGYIYADTSFKDLPLLGNGWCWDDKPSVYHPYISPLQFDRGRLTPESNKYPREATYNPALHFVQTLVSQLAKEGVGCRGCAINADTPPRSTLLYSKKTNILELLPRIMKNSDNLYAEALFAQMAHSVAGNNATYKDGAQVVTNVLKKAGVNAGKVKIHDGCGLSPYDFLTPSTLVDMLRYAYNNKQIYNDFFPSLPIAGQDGTIEKRMIRKPAQGNVFAKTGTVTGVSSLAGYVTASNGHILAFAIINNGVLKATFGHKIQDRICNELAR